MRIRPIVLSVLLSTFIAVGIPQTGLLQIFSTPSVDAATVAAKKPAAKAKPAVEKPIDKTSYEPVESLAVVRNPEQWLGKKVTFDGVFNSFDGFALDYKPAFRDSKDFVSVLIRRPDAPQHSIPLSELKMVFPRSKSKSVRDLEPGDKVKIHGKVFSTALGDPWMEIDNLEITEKNPNSKTKTEKKS